MQSIGNVVLPFHAIQPLLSMLSDANLSLDDYLPSQFRDVGIPASDYYSVLNRVAMDLGDESYHFSQRALIPGSKALMLNVALQSSNFLDALKRLAHSANALYGGTFNRVYLQRSNIVYVVDNRQFPYTFEDPGFSHLSMEYAMVYFIASLIIVSESSVERNVVKLLSRRPHSDCQYDIFSYLNVPVEYGCDCYGVVFNQHVTDTPIHSDLSEMLLMNAIMREFQRLLQQGLIRDNEQGSVTDRVIRVFGRGIFSQTLVADKLAMSVATLKRRLTDEQNSFRDLRRTFLLNSANQMLSEQVSLPVIAEQLGFADINSFGRAYKQWTGTTPASYRNQSS